jgi:cystathionine beta-lyase
MTHKSIPAEKRRSAGVADSLIRLSVGLEEVEDLVKDIEQAFQKATVAAEVATAL